MIKMYWWRERPNFGDAMNPYLVKQLFGIDVEWSEIAEASLIGVGSTLEWIATAQRELKKDLYVWGSGYIRNVTPPITSERVKIQALRGLRSKLPSGAGNIPLGDPGLLCDHMFSKPSTKHFAIGVVPHFWNEKDAAFAKLIDNYPSLKVINVSDDPIEVMKSISQCEFIYSSSLHGLVVADSFGIPNQWVEFDTVIYGNGWKFKDYYSVFPMEAPKPVKLSEEQDLRKLSEAVTVAYQRKGLERIKASLFEAFPTEQLRGLLF